MVRCFGYYPGPTGLFLPFTDSPMENELKVFNIVASIFQELLAPVVTLTFSL